MKIKAIKDDCGKGFGIYWVTGKYNFTIFIQFWSIEVSIWIPIDE